MRGLIPLILFAAFGWSGWWWVGSTAQETAVKTWLSERRIEGWRAEVGDYKIIGFPNRFDNFFTDLTLFEPARLWGWRAAEFQVMALSYKPNHIIANWPGEHVVSTPFDTITLAAELLRGSVVFKPETSLALARIQLEIAALNFAGMNGWQARIDKANVAFFTDESLASNRNAYKVFVKSTDVTPPAIWRQNTSLPEDISEVSLDATLHYDRPWDRFAVEQNTPRLTAISIHDLQFNWGTLVLQGVGDIAVNDQGFAQGHLTLHIQNWRDLLQLLSAAGILPDGISEGLRKSLEVITRAAGNTKTIKLPLRFSKNRTYIGIIPIGLAPLLYP
ncbi:MAG: DUF2125 domain-containing protein [Paracoccaceae bacterium]